MLLALACPVRGQSELRRPRVIAPPAARDVILRGLVRLAPRADAHAWRQGSYELLRQEGWLWARLRSSQRGDSLFVQPGLRAVLGTVTVRGADSLASRAFLDEADLRSGRPYRPARWESQIGRALRRMGEAGHPFASVSILELQGDAESGRVDLTILLSIGREARIRRVLVTGATHTRPDVLARLSGLGPETPFRESRLREARERLLSREIVQDIVAVEPVLASSDGSEVDVHVDLLQPPSTGRVSAALGLVRDPADPKTRISGSVDLALLDLSGTARQLHARFLDDGETRRRLDVRYLEPLVLGSPLDLAVALGQRHEDELYDTVLGDLSLRLPFGGWRQLELGAGADRTSFIGEVGRLRVRRRLNAALALHRRRPDGSGLYGGLRSRVEAARVEESFSSPAPGAPAARTESQTLVEIDGRLALSFSGRLALETRGAWATVVTDDLPIPESEQYFIGGTRTVRGHREEETHGETVGYGGVELVLGSPRAGQGYAFYDLGFRRESVLAGEGTEARESWIRGFGLGLRTPAVFGRIDLSIGFARQLSFDEGLVHLALVQEF